MSGLGVLALLREAHAALPNGTAHERTLWIQQRRRELEAQPPSERLAPVTPGPKRFALIADDPAVKRSRESS